MDLWLNELTGKWKHGKSFLVLFGAFFFFSFRASFELLKRKMTFDNLSERKKEKLQEEAQGIPKNERNCEIENKDRDGFVTQLVIKL